jgi:hypothetical protein
MVVPEPGSSPMYLMVMLSRRPPLPGDISNIIIKFKYMYACARRGEREEEVGLC